MRYVYVLVDRGELAISYASLCLLSATSVRGVDPAARITIVADPATVRSLRQRKHRVLDAADDWVEATAEGTPTYISRFLKTTLLQRLQDSFVYLDGDTVVVRPIAGRGRHPASLQMVADRFLHHPKPGFPDWVRPLYQQMGWEPTRHYFNAGVIFVRNDGDAGRLFEQWHDRWQAFVRATGRMNDQPALNSAIEACGVSVAHLPLRYNAMVKVRERYRWRARTLHFFIDQAAVDEGTAYGSLLARAERGPLPTFDDISRGMRCRRPLVDPWSVKRQIAAGDALGLLGRLCRWGRRKAASSIRARIRRCRGDGAPSPDLN
jgi:hypothetical protein